MSTKFKLKVFLVPTEYEKISIEHIDPRKYISFLYITFPETKIEDIEPGLCQRFLKRYPDEGELVVLSYQDNELLDLDPEFEIQDVFDSQNNQIRVLVDNTFTSVTYSPEPAISTPLDFQKTSNIPDGVYLRESKDARMTPRKGKSSSIASPVALAPPKTKADRSIPKKKASQKRKSNRITSGMLESPPKSKESQLANAGRLDVGRLKSPNKTDARGPPRKKIRRVISSSSGSSGSSTDEDINEEDFDYDPDDYTQVEDDDNEKIEADEIIGMVEDMKSQDSSGLDEEISRMDPTQRSIRRQLQINTVEGNPSLYLGRTKRRAAREASMVLNRASSSKTAPKVNKLQKPASKTVHPFTTTTKPKPSVASKPIIPAKPAITTKPKPVTLAKPKPEPVATTPSKKRGRPPRKPAPKTTTPGSIISDLHSRLKLYQLKVKELTVEQDGAIAGYDVIPKDFEKGLRPTTNIYEGAPVDVRLYLTQRPKQTSVFVTNPAEEVVETDPPVKLVIPPRNLASTDLGKDDSNDSSNNNDIAIAKAGTTSIGINSSTSTLSTVTTNPNLDNSTTSEDKTISVANLDDRTNNGVSFESKTDSIINSEEKTESILISEEKTESIFISEEKTVNGVSSEDKPNIDAASDDKPINDTNSEVKINDTPSSDPVRTNGSNMTAEPAQNKPFAKILYPPSDEDEQKPKVEVKQAEPDPESENTDRHVDVFARIADSSDEEDQKLQAGATTPPLQEPFANIADSSDEDEKPKAKKFDMFARIADSSDDDAN
ncbi:hypothetical protein Cantr_06513 [Candida viswanathii]|uniref:Nucleolar protein Dnt1-like N-terminal domain-containing protein n=1 Tax=Candida viswanathii TaxID=5486 RepID=A0A367XWF3_9ASCO|nr:hypothetical protein Cantr_06513 [Candida viswanathii]